MTFPVVRISDLGITETRFVSGLHSQIWASNNVTVSFTNIGRFADDNPTPLTEEAIATYREAFARIEAVADITFVEVDGDPQVAIFQRIDISSAGLALFPTSLGSYSATKLDDPSLNIVTHEILHSIGLTDPGSDPDRPNPLLIDGLHTILFTDSNAPVLGTDLFVPRLTTGLLIDDIETLQRAYGANTAPTAGGDTYVYDTSAEFVREGIYDSGGYDSVIIIDDENKGVKIDLTPRAGWDVGSILLSGNINEPDFDIIELRETVHTTADTVLERVVSAGGDDTLFGNDADNTLVGHGGSDFVYGGAGDDFIFAGSGDDAGDHIDGGAGNDVLGGGAGDDTILGGAGSDQLFGGEGDDIAVVGGFTDANDNDRYDAGEENTSDTSASVAYTGTGNDTIIGAAGDDELGGGLGADVINGEGGDDTLYGGRDTLDDVLSSGAGDDLLFAGDGNETVTGGAGSDQLFGGGGDDVLDAGEGDDEVFGGAGNDTLTGGAGSDIFYFNASGDADVVTDFDVADDLLFISNTVTDFTDLDSVLAASSETQLGGVSGLLIDAGGGNSIFLEGIAAADLFDTNFTY